MQAFMLMVKQESFVDETGQVKKRVKRIPQSQWEVFIHDHHQGFINWETYEMIQTRIAKNTRPVAHQDTGAIREGAALLQGLATCGKCGRRLRVYYQGKHSTPGYYCAANNVMDGRAKYCMRVGGVKIDEAVTGAFLDAMTPAAIEAALLAEKTLKRIMMLPLLNGSSRLNGSGMRLSVQNAAIVPWSLKIVSWLEPWRHSGSYVWANLKMRKMNLSVGNSKALKG